MLFEIFDPKAAPKPIGIDLGTTNSLVACVRNEKPETIANCDGERLLPSVVSYAEGAPVVGTRAMKLAASAPRVWPDIAGNLAFSGRVGDAAATDKAFAEAATVVAVELINQRVVTNYMETRAVVAEFVAGTGGTSSGLAYQILMAGLQLNIPRMFAALLLIALAGIAFYVLASVFAWLALHRWHDSARPL